VIAEPPASGWAIRGAGEDDVLEFFVTVDAELLLLLEESD
jgi:hypothetical protein